VPVPLIAASVAVYASPTTPIGRLVVVTASPGGPTVNAIVSVAVFLPESVTVTVKLTLPRIGVAPEITPALDKLNPTVLRLPEVSVHV
jgi:hypothetical protein